MSNGIVFRPPVGAIPMEPASPRYAGSFGLRSASSNAIYKVSWDKVMQCWVCSCRGCITHGQCKHLTAAGLKGRKYGRQAEPVFLR